jgi:hypothetical protein
MMHDAIGFNVLHALNEDFIMIDKGEIPISPLSVVRSLSSLSPSMTLVIWKREIKDAALEKVGLPLGFWM